MAGTIKGITIEIGGNTGPLDKALQGINKTSRDLQNELKQVEKLLKLDPTNTDLLAQRQKLLAESVDNTKNKLNTLKEAEKQVQEQVKQGKVSEEQYRAFQREIASTEIKMQGLENQGKKTYEILSKDDAVKNLKNIGIAAGAAAVVAGAALVGMAGAALENADEIQRLSDVTGISAERLQELKYAGNNLGVELETITGAQAKLTKSMDAAKDGTGTQAEAFKTLGINILDSNGQLKSAETVMSEAFTALNGVGNETERDALAMSIFGKSAMELNPLIKAGGDELNRLADEARNSGAVMSNEAVAGLDSFGDTLDNIKNSIMGAFGESLGQLMPQIQELISKIDLEKVKQGISEFAEKAIQLLNFIIDNGSTITSLIAGIGAGFIAWNVASMIDGVVTSIKAFKAATEGATIAQKALNAAQSANPIGLIVMLIAGLVATVITLWHTNEDFRNALIDAWEAIKSAVTTAVEKVKSAFNTVIDFIKNNWQGILLLLVAPFAGAFKLLYDNCDEFKNFVDEFVLKVKNAFVDTWNSIESFFNTTVPAWINSITTTFSELPGKIYNAIISIIDKLGEIKDSMVAWVTNDLPEFINSFINKMESLPSAMLDIGKNIVSGIWDGITNMKDWLLNKVKNFTGDIVDGIKSKLQIHSPSKVLADEVGKYMAQGIGVGFEDEMGSVSMNMAKAIPTSNSDYSLNNSGSTSNGNNSNIIESLYDLFDSIPQQAVDLYMDTTKVGRVMLPKLITERKRLGLNNI